MYCQGEIFTRRLYLCDRARWWWYLLCLCVRVCVRERHRERENAWEHLCHNILWGRRGTAPFTSRYDFQYSTAQEQEAIKFNVTLSRLATDAFYVGASLWVFLTTVMESGEGMLFSGHTRTLTHTSGRRCGQDWRSSFYREDTYKRRPGRGDI